MNATIKQERLHLEQIQKLLEHTALGSSATVINSLILSFVLWNVAPKMSLIIWFALLVAVSVVRFYLQKSYPKTIFDLEKAKKWKNWFLMTLAISGIIWGAAGIFLFPLDSIGHQVFIAFVLGGMVAGSVGVFSVVFSAFLSFSIPALLPIMAMFFYINDVIHIAMGLMVSLFWLIMLFTAQRLNKTIATSLSLKYENIDLISELQAEIQERKKVEKELIRKTEEIEAIVEERTAELIDTNKKLVREVEVRKNAEHAFRESETRLRALINHAPIVLWAINSDGKFTFSEGKGLTSLNLKPGEVVGKSLFELYGDNEQIVNDAREALSGGEVSSTTKVDGIIFESRYLPIIDKKGLVTGAIGVAIDVTERKRAEEELQFTKFAIDHSSDGAFWMDPDARFIYVNDAATRTLGYSREELLNMTVHDIDPGFPKEAWLEHWKDLKQRVSFIIESHHRTKDGRIFPVEITVNYLEFGGKEYNCTFARDISERKKNEEIIQLSRKEWTSTFDAMADWVSLLDLEYKILRSNRSGEKFLDIPIEKMIGRTCCELTHGTEEPIPECPMQKMINTCQRESVDLYAKEMNRWLRVSVDPVMDEDGNLEKAVHIVRDITELKKMEEERLKVMKLESVGIMAGGIAHDFNNLLSIILGNIELVKDDIEPEVGISEYLVEVEKATYKSKELTKQLITFSKGGEPVKAIGSIEDLLKETANLVLFGTDIKCEFHLPENLWLAEFDEEQIKHAIKNMLVNSVEAMPKGGLIEIQAENSEISIETIEPDLQPSKGKYVKISISDQGVGISEEHLPQIFDPYFSTKDMGIQKGMGLGLATTYSIINKHDGHITVESEVGIGTVFTLYLPAYEKDEREPKPIEPPIVDKEIISTGRILLMDDEEMIRSLAKQMLSRFGYDADLAQDGAEAIELYKKAIDAGKPFDAVILDLTVKEGMGGKDAVKRLMEIDPRVKAVVSSGYSTDPVMADFRKYGFIAALPKPYTMKDLEDTLGKINNID